MVAAEHVTCDLSDFPSLVSVDVFKENTDSNVCAVPLLRSAGTISVTSARIPSLAHTKVLNVILWKGTSAPSLVSAESISRYCSGPNCQEIDLPLLMHRPNKACDHLKYGVSPVVVFFQDIPERVRGCFWSLSARCPYFSCHCEMPECLKKYWLFILLWTSCYVLMAAAFVGALLYSYYFFLLLILSVLFWHIGLCTIPKDRDDK